MSQNIYEMLNNIRTDYTEYEEDTVLNETEKRRYKKRILERVRGKRHDRKKIIAAAACIAFCLAQVGMGPMKGQVKAAARLLSYNIQTAFGVKKDLTKYENIVNKSVTKDGRTITLNKVILDRDALVVSMTESGVLDEGHPIGVLYINGRSMNLGASGQSRDTAGGTRESVMEYDLDGVDVGGDLDIDLELEGDEHTVWEFSFTASGKELSANTEEVPVKAGFRLPDGSQAVFTYMSVNDLGCKLFYDLKGYTKSYDLKLEGEDNLGNPIEFYLSRSSKQGGRLKLDQQNCPLSEKASSITLTPYAAEMPERSGKMSDDWIQAGEAFTIDLK